MNNIVAHSVETLVAFRRSPEGRGLAEYVRIVTLVAILLVLALALFQNQFALLVRSISSYL